MLAFVMDLENKSYYDKAAASPHALTCTFCAHRFAVVIADAIGVRNKQEVVPPSLTLLQVVKKGAREDGLVLQWNLEVERVRVGVWN